MIPFNLWSQAFIFASIYSVIILVPCILVLFIGQKMIRELGQYPSKTPSIQMSIFVQLVTIEVVTFILMVWFLKFFSH